ncbi:enoyl-CoA hydratase/isomerase family protein [Ruegeria arenilitoris]|uniref:enoyl-CoA hydratase/isomerase family protein n=1 Tax=Ruegeria arenilitoris TaxID=1173585 RepID=UPI00147DE22D|nr:enoyl-CoA hydratase-related protein [Ruegeria arenilitoris]
MTRKLLDVTSKDGVAEMRLNNPERMNTLGSDMTRAFLEATAGLVEDRSIRVIILSGEGRCFSAGGDLAELHGAEDKERAAHRVIRPIHKALILLANTSKIVVASVQGPVSGAGFSIALGSDLCVAASDAIFNLAYLKVAVPPDCGASWNLPRLVGTRRAFELALLSNSIDSQKALELGLVNRVVDPESLTSETWALAKKIAEGPATAQGMLKRLMQGSWPNSFSEQLADEELAFSKCVAGPDFKEAASAFFEKRSPKFSSKKELTFMTDH